VKWDYINEQTGVLILCSLCGGFLAHISSTTRGIYIYIHWHGYTVWTYFIFK